MNNLYNDVFEELEQMYPNDILYSTPNSTPKSNYNTNISPISNIKYITNIQTILDFPKNELLITNCNDKKLYNRPGIKSYDIYYIWMSADIPDMATIYTIENLLIDWAFTYACLEIVQKRIINIMWKTHSNSICSATWKTFIHWMISAS